MKLFSFSWPFLRLHFIRDIVNVPRIVDRVIVVIVIVGRDNDVLWSSQIISPGGGIRRHDDVLGRVQIIGIGRPGHLHQPETA